MPYTNAKNPGSEPRSIISIIIVTYNAQPTIQRTLNSVLGQTYKNTEIIIIDGVSSDGTVELIKECIDTPFKLVSEPDKGIYDAMNKGVCISTGDWVIFMNSGDTFASEAVLEELFSGRPIESDIDLLYGNTVVKDSGVTIRPPSSLGKGFFFYETICHQSIFCRNEIFSKIGYFNTCLKIAADREWLIKAICAKLKFRYVPIDVCVWEKEGFSTQHRDLSAVENVLLQKNYFSYPERFILPWKMRYKNFRDRFSFFSPRSKV
jgi:glycosyltransferase involved in cell wall biosynthesis